MNRIYRIMDRLLDPLPKEISKKRDKAGVMLYYEAQEEGYKRYKYLQYRNLILESALSFLLGLLFCFLLELV